MILTYRYRIKDRSARKHLERHARAVNYVWNYLCETQRHAQKWQRHWPGAYELEKLCAGTSKELNILADTNNVLCREFAKARRSHGRCPRFRSSRKSLGWIPLKFRSLPMGYGWVRYRGRELVDVPNDAPLQSH